MWSFIPLLILAPGQPELCTLRCLLHVVHFHDPQGGVRGDARRRPCVHHSWARLGLQVRHILHSCRNKYIIKYIN